jgi:ABC-type transport system substrate-binding protein
MSNNKGVSNSHLPELSRRGLLAASAAGAASLYLAKSAHAERALLDAGERSGAVKTVTGATLPANAAPLSQQYLVVYANSVGATYKCMDFYESVYSRAPLADNFSTSLVRINNNYQVVPGAAHSWKQTSPTTWEFYITPGIMWTDGNEVTANDFVETFRYSADPKHAWDFTWYWTSIGLKNYAAAVAGKVPTSSIGVAVGKDKYTFVVTTAAPVAFIPSAMLYSQPLSAAGLAKYGNGLYNVNPATSISMGPYILKSFNPTSEVVLGPNPKYTAGFGSPIQWQIAKIYAGAPALPILATGAVDWNPNALTKTDLQIAKSTPKISGIKPYLNPIDFRVHYVFFKTKAKPFDNLKVRQAFAHSADRDSIISALVAPLGTPAYGFLMGGFPFAVSDPLKKYTNYNPAMAQKLLAQAGYPNGKGFPEVTFSYPAALGTLDPVTTGLFVQALAANWNKVLFGGGSTILLQELDNATFYAKMQAKPETQIEMGAVSYGMDYFDASNMLGVYQGGGRHDWNNAQYDKLLAQGAAVADHNQRQAIYTKAQILQTSQAPAVFIFFGLGAYLQWPYLQGPTLAKNSLGYNGIQWPGFQTFSTHQQGLYIANNVGQYPRQSESGLS